MSDSPTSLSTQPKSVLGETVAKLDQLYELQKSLKDGSGLLSQPLADLQRAVAELTDKTLEIQRTGIFIDDLLEQCSTASVQDIVTYNEEETSGTLFRTLVLPCGVEVSCETQFRHGQNDLSSISIVSQNIWISPPEGKLIYEVTAEGLPDDASEAHDVEAAVAAAAPALRFVEAPLEQWWGKRQMDNLAAQAYRCLGANDHEVASSFKAATGMSPRAFVNRREAGDTTLMQAVQQHHRAPPLDPAPATSQVMEATSEDLGHAEAPTHRPDDGPAP